jgi:hypothetical protein
MTLVRRLRIAKALLRKGARCRPMTDRDTRFAISRGFSAGRVAVRPSTPCDTGSWNVHDDRDGRVHLVGRARLVEVCNRDGVADLAVFGPVAWSETNESSDVDLPCVLARGARLVRAIRSPR